MAKHVIHPFTGEAHQIGPDSLIPPSSSAEDANHAQSQAPDEDDEDQFDRLFSGGPWNYMSLEGCGPYSRD